MRVLFVLLVIVGLTAGGAAYYYNSQAAAGATTSFRTAAISRGELLSTISATGTVEPEEVIDVGAQVVGRIKSLGIDPSDPQKKRTIDYGSVVDQGTVLALIDDSVYKAQVLQAEASLLRSKADLMQMEANRDRAEQDWKRANGLRPKGAIADTDFDLAQANYKAAVANVEVGKAVVKQSEAALELAKTNLDYTIIRSPVEGKIIDRRINVGQTVVANLNVASMFLIAKDLRKIQVWASVNEADIGRIRVDMPVQFTVDAYPGEVFHGKVSQIRLNAMTTQNVITYTVVVATDNSDGHLLPYLTANLQFEIERRSNILRVPNVALRWRPRPEQIDPELRSAGAAESSGTGGNSDKAPTLSLAAMAKSAKEREQRGRIWLVDGAFVRPVDVSVGASDGTVTEIAGDGVNEDMQVVVGENRSNQSDGATTNPFVPQMRRGGSQRPKG